MEFKSTRSMSSNVSGAPPSTHSTQAPAHTQAGDSEHALFSGGVPVTVSNGSREELKRSLHFHMHMSTEGPQNLRVLRVRVTEEVRVCVVDSWSRNSHFRSLCSFFVHTPNNIPLAVPSGINYVRHLGEVSTTHLKKMHSALGDAEIVTFTNKLMEYYKMLQACADGVLPVKHFAGR